ncbi:MAG: ATP phosphoribosyltransferase regulatory subunit, partial [Clostridiaceae bacterium]|nr:ATP phosphoribosyltransferase regulatory subunit [Clostridiaceae bacterium]
DNLVEKFGLKLPATGFSLGVNLVMNALERQQSCMEKPQIDSLIYYEKKGRKTAFEICNQLRLQGLGIQMDITMAGKERVEAYARAMGIGGIIGVLDEDLIEIHNLENNEIKRVSRSELLK